MAIVLIPLLIGLDQALKLWALGHLGPVPERLLPGIYLSLVQNSGASFGLFKGHAELLAWVSIIVGVLLLVYLARAKRMYWVHQLAISLIATGALGNAIDRIGRGWVVDYLNIGPGLWPVFNLADASVFVGVILLVLSLARR